MQSFFSIILLLSLAAAFPGKILGQCPSPLFDVSPGSACQEQNIFFSNLSAQADTFYWDFCANDLEQVPTDNVIQNISAASQPFGYATIFEDDQWFSFIVNRGTGTVIRLDFGQDLLNPTPDIIDLGNPANALSQPEDIEVIEINGSWYALITQNLNAPNNNIILLDFGNDITNAAPAVTDLGNFGVTTKIRGVSVGVDDAEIVIAVAQSNKNITLVNFGNSFASIPNDTLHMSNIGAGNMFSIDIYNECDQWFAVAPSNNTLNLFSFGADLFSTPVNTTYGFMDISSTAFDTDILADGDSTYVIIGNISAPYILINLGRVQSGDTPVQIDPSPTINPTLTALSIVNYNGAVVVHGINSSKDLYRVEYRSDCGASVEFSTESDPPLVNYSLPGNHMVNLSARNSLSGFKSNYSGSVSISSNTAPSISFGFQNVCQSSPIQFTSESGSEGLTYNWDFGDSNNSTEPNPSHTYAAPGLYEVELEVSDGTCNNRTVQEIEIFEEPIPDFTFPTGTLCSNSPIQFTNTTTGEAGEVVDWQWDFNGEGTSSAKDTAFTFTSGGLKQVTLTASIPGCTNFIGQNITVEQGPVAGFDFQNTCFQEETEFINNSSGANITGHFWDFGNGTTSTLENPSLVYSEPGEYPVSLQVTNDLGCITEFLDTLTIHSIPLVNFTNDLACKGAQVQFQDQSLVENANLTEWDWQFESVQGTLSTINSSEQNPLVVFDTPGEYSVKFTVASNFGCSDSLERTINVLDAPTVDFDYVSACAGDSLKLLNVSDTSGFTIIDKLWMVDTASFTTSNPTVLIQESGEVDVSLTLTSDNLCAVTKSESIFVSDFPTADFSFSSTCVNEVITFSDASDSEIPIVDYEWDFGGLGKAFEPEIDIMFPSVGEFNVSLTVANENGCINTIAKDILIEAAPEADFEVSQTIGASPLEVETSNNSTGAETFQWTTANEESNESDPTFVFEDLGTHEIALVATSSSGCRDTARQTVEVVVPEFEVELQQVNTIIDGDNIQLILTIRNNGTVLIEHLDILVEVGNAINLTNQFEESLPPNEVVNYTLDFQIVGQPELLFICVSIRDDLQDIVDSNLNNNIRCINLAEQAVFNSPFPNPIENDIITFPMILPLQGTVTFTVINSIGEIALKRDFESAAAGLNEFSLDTSALKQGIYIVRIDYGGRDEIFRIFKQ